jgi:hypothetical protein
LGIFLNNGLEPTAQELDKDVMPFGHVNEVRLIAELRITKLVFLEGSVSQSRKLSWKKITSLHSESGSRKKSAKSTS